jgi:ElaB/YqjD/DUF883 family membrane-anchored ribosome-binding protein
MDLEDYAMKYQTSVSHARHNAQARLGRLYKTAGRIKGKTSRVLAKSLRDVKSKTKDLSKNVDRIVVKNRYQTIGAAVVTGLCLGYFLKNK